MNRLAITVPLRTDVMPYPMKIILTLIGIRWNVHCYDYKLFVIVSLASAVQHPVLLHYQDGFVYLCRDYRCVNSHHCWPANKRHSDHNRKQQFWRIARCLLVKNYHDAYAYFKPFGTASAK